MRKVVFKDPFPSPFGALFAPAAEKGAAAARVRDLPKRMIEAAKEKAKEKFAKPSVARSIAPQSVSGFTVSFARTREEVLEAQRLRYKVFAEEMGASVPRATDDDGQAIDADMFDKVCDHLLVRDNATLQVIGTYRILPPHQARKIGCTYSEGEFFLTRLQPLRSNMVELGRSCVHRDYRSGAVIMLLWKGIAEYMKAGGYEHLFGCASISMRDGGHAAATLFKHLETDHMASPEYHVFPRTPLPVAALAEGEADVEAPPLVKGYLRVGAQICGAPAWDPDFNTADLPMLLSLSRMNPRYRKHFFGM